MYYRLELTNDAKTDLDELSKYLEEKGFYRNKVIEKINKDIVNLKYMPRIHKALLYLKDKQGEYRRIISGKYIIIYQINKDCINILRVFSEKQNYLNSENFIVKEEIQKYYRKKREDFKMIKFRKLKNTYVNSKENFTHITSKEEAMNRYMIELIDEVENIPEEERIYYTHEEFWKMVEEKEIEKYGHVI